MLLIAANDACSLSKDRADLVCNGIDDHAEIESAIGLLPSGGGHIALSEGTFNLSEQFPKTEKKITVTGEGINSTILSFPDLEDAAVEPSWNWTLKDFQISAGGSSKGLYVPVVSWVLAERLYITGASTGVEVKGSQTTLRNVIVGGFPKIGFKLVGNFNQLYGCQAGRNSAGGNQAYNIHMTGGLLSGCSAGKYPTAFRFDSYTEFVSLIYPHIEDCDIDFQMKTVNPQFPPHHVRVFGGLHSGIVDNPNNYDIVFYE